MNKQPFEILAPAGNADMLKAAVFAGANSVYLGLTGFNARRSAGNFTPQELVQAVAFCHARGVLVNVTLNTLCYDTELPALQDAIGAVAAAGADAVIVQDLAAAALVKRTAPGLALHGSTQMSVTNLAGAKQLAAMGFSRVILARELTAGEVREITEHCGIETEIFVHGALCMSVSGQCLMSAFYGGRSGNRGGCAGPCRLPYRIGSDEGHFLSLRDLSLIDRLPDIQQMGVRCAKIEGRLRTPEYVAAAVHAARCALAGEAYDADLLQHAFSRAGFTSGFYDNDYLNAAMFGRRSEEQAAETRAALPQLRELYRRERPCVALQLTLAITETGVTLTATDGDGNKATAHNATVPSAAQNTEEALVEGYQKALCKTGGTPFAAVQITVQGAAGRYLPAAVINELRREALAELLRLREAPRPKPFCPVALPTKRRAAPALPALLELRFQRAGQCTDALAQAAGRLVFPLREAAALPAGWQAKTVLSLPRAIFDEADTRRAVAAATALGFTAFEVQNIGALGILADEAPGATLLGGFGLNITNAMAAAQYATLGLFSLTLSPELPVAAAGTLAAPVPTGLPAYGHLPLMLTRACPMRNRISCAQCKGEGELVDRKGKPLRILCTGPGRGGVRQLLNPIPLWMGERKQELGTDFAALYFTTETAARCAEVTRLFTAGLPYDGEFTRGLYYKGSL